MSAATALSSSKLLRRTAVPNPLANTPTAATTLAVRSVTPHEPTQDYQPTVISDVAVRPGSDEVTYAEAGRLEYNLKDGVVEFSEDAIITEGGNQISSSFLVYNILERRINAQSSGNGDEKVKITYTPTDADTPTENVQAGDENQ